MTVGSTSSVGPNKRERTAVIDACTSASKQFPTKRRLHVSNTLFLVSSLSGRFNGGRWPVAMDRSSSFLNSMVSSISASV